jgi:AraC family transcriptional regulator
MFLGCWNLPVFSILLASMFLASIGVPSLRTTSTLPFTFSVDNAQMVVQERQSMAEVATYGTRMAAHLQVGSAPVIATQTRRKSQLAVTRLRSDAGMEQMSTAMPAAAAYTVTMYLRENPKVQLWHAQKMVHDGPYPKGGLGIMDLMQEPTFFTPAPFDCLQFYISREALDEIAYDHGAVRIANLTWPRGNIDLNFNHLIMSLIPATESPEGTSQLFVEQVMMALLIYSAQTFGGMQAKAKIARGGLAPWQMRRATELLSERLDGEVSLSEVAAECNLSVGHFARSFKQAIGQTPHRWLLDRRVDEAKNLMLHSGLRLADIALDCGFTDQTSFNRTFKKIAGTSPGDWRRACRQ